MTRDLKGKRHISFHLHFNELHFFGIVSFPVSSGAHMAAQTQTIYMFYEAQYATYNCESMAVCELESCHVVFSAFKSSNQSKEASI